jgi:hypothetical protein
MVLKNPAPSGGQGFEKPHVRGGNGFEKLAEKGSLGSENRHKVDLIRTPLEFWTTRSGS